MYYEARAGFRQYVSTSPLILSRFFVDSSLRSDVMRRIRIPHPPSPPSAICDLSVLHCYEGYALLRLVSLLCDTWMTGPWGFCDTIMPADPAIAEIGLSSITYFDYYLCVTHWKSLRSAVFSSPNVNDNNKYCLRYAFARKN